MFSRTIEDYLETIYNLIERKGYARTKDIADELGVRPPSVTEMLKKLHEKKLVSYEKSSGVTLTSKGRKIAYAVKTRHDTFTNFLKMILVPEYIAEKDACEIEHHLDPTTIEQFTKFVEFMGGVPAHCEWLNEFKAYCKNGKIPECTRKNI